MNIIKITIESLKCFSESCWTFNSKYDKITGEKFSPCPCVMFVNNEYLAFIYIFHDFFYLIVKHGAYCWSVLQRTSHISNFPITWNLKWLSQNNNISGDWAFALLFGYSAIRRTLCTFSVYFIYFLGNIMKYLYLRQIIRWN